MSKTLRRPAPHALHISEFPPTGWHKSSYSEGGEHCVEADDAALPAFRAPNAAWTTYIHAIHADRIWTTCQVAPPQGD
ncbi:DUF397 domain-containing protein [Streptomyces sp. OF3]|uniref:DUF397 domain-containing protein n=1 Tax=Streptomyces alkaliterrae TaxID=2213162 RepID=A0A7W3WRQ4_9ACTN|nr:DUF397 domain-containing protein [Streptomyces alkaliterrae]MBB1256920.1 DUF397 domain-containing protein [Streptomyces alkaliterrae]